MPGSDSQQRQSGQSVDPGFMEGDTQTSVSSTGAPTLYSHRLVVLGDLADQPGRARDYAPLLSPLEREAVPLRV